MHGYTIYRRSVAYFLRSSVLVFTIVYDATLVAYFFVLFS